ncbi:MAG: hypothetical protein ACLGGX_05970 [Bdellovibrionia bacterium]
MNTQWLTTLITNVKGQVEQGLKERGLKLDPADLTALLEEISPEASKAALSYALDIFKPFTQGMGVRIARLSDSHIEVVLPQRPHNLTAHKEFHEGVVLGAGLEAIRTLWARHAPLGEFFLYATKVNLEIHRPPLKELRFKLEMIEAQREAVLAELRRHRKSQQDLQLKIYDENDQLVADLDVQIALQFQPSLAASEDSQKKDSVTES